MRSWDAILAGLLLAMFVTASCATINPAVVEEEEKEEDSIQKWLEWQDMELWRPWRALDPGRSYGLIEKQRETDLYRY